MNIKKMIATISLGAFALFLLAPMSASAAENNVRIRDNGNFSWNSAWVFNMKKSRIVQHNTTHVNTNVGVHSNTGKNKSWFNVGENNSNTIETGDTETNVTVEVEGGNNENTNNCDCEENSTSATISGNGNFSTNSIFVVNKNKKSVHQSNTTSVNTNIGASSNTGGNSSSFNVGGGSSITSGDATTTVDVSVEGSTNTNN